MSDTQGDTTRAKRGSMTLTIGGPKGMHLEGDQFAEPVGRAKEWGSEAKAITDRCGWSYDEVITVAQSWHPGLMIEGEGAYWLAAQAKRPLGVNGANGGSPLLYVEWEKAAGRLTNGWTRIPALNAMADREARLRFLWVSAALVVDGMYRLADCLKFDDPQHGDAVTWRALYWLARFYGNMRQVKDAMTSRDANRGKAGRQPDTEAVERVLHYYDSIMRSGGHDSIVATIVARMHSDISDRTVRKYLKAHRPDYTTRRRTR